MKKITFVMILFLTVVAFYPRDIIFASESRTLTEFEKSLIGTWEYTVTGICSGGADCDITIVGETGRFEFKANQEVEIFRNNGAKEHLSGTFTEVNPRILKLFLEIPDNTDDFYLEMNTSYANEGLFRIDVRTPSGEISQYDSLGIALELKKTK